MSSSIPAADVAAPRARRGRVVLAVACAAQFVTVLDVSIVNVALPPIQRELMLSATGLQWVVNAYALTFAGFLLLGGRAADLWGLKRSFLGGVVLFSLGSLACALAQTGWQLVAARAVQGLGGAVVVPSTLSLITTTFVQPPARARALSVMTAAAAAGGGLGGVIGGILTGLFGWRWVFLVNVPLGFALALGAAWALTGSRPTTTVRLDLPGSFSVTVGTAAVVAAVVLSEDRGILDPVTLGCVAVAVTSLALFVVAERRAPDPLVPLSVLRVRPVAVANLLGAVLGGLLPATMFFLVLYLQQVLGMDPLEAGLALTPGAVGIALGAAIASRVMGRISPRATFRLGASAALVALLWLSRIRSDGSYPVDVLVPLVLAMTGFGLAGLPLTTTATLGLGQARAGLASGLLSSSRQIGGAVGLALLVAVALRFGPIASPAAVTSTSTADPTDGFAAGLLAGAVLLVLALAGSVGLPHAARRPPPHPRTTPP